MPRILISASFPESLLARQTPGGRGVWDEFEFVFEAGDEPVDGWVVYDTLRDPITQFCPPTNTLLITGEPESVRRYRPRFTGQFAHVWTSQRNIQHPHVTHRNEGQHWHYGMCSSSAHGRPLQYDDLIALAAPHKTKQISVICSNKALTPDHQQRLEFVQALRQSFGDSIDFLGRGFQPVEDKADAIWPYRYHIVLENDHTEHFMTEKIADAFLGWSYPIYFGGPEAYHRFPEGSFTAIDIYRPDQALAIVRDVLAGDTYATSLPQIALARERVLKRHNIFAMLADYWREHLQDERPERMTLLPKSHGTGLVLRQFGRHLAHAGRRVFSQRVA